MSNQGSIHEFTNGARKPEVRRARGRLLSLLAVALALAWAAGDAGAQAPAPSSFSETYGDWRVKCGSPSETAPRQCGMEQELRVRDEKTGRSHRLMAVTLTVPKKGGGVELSALTPFGLLLARGAKLRIDEGESFGPLPFWTCLRGGCVLRGPIDAARTALLAKGRKLHLGMISTAEKPFDVAISLKGFTSAFKRLRAAAP